MLKNDIKVNAGILWHLLEESGQLSIREIIKHTGFKKEYVLMSLGWLARENKVELIIEGQNDEIKARLDCLTSELYY